MNPIARCKIRKLVAERKMGYSINLKSVKWNKERQNQKERKKESEAINKTIPIVPRPPCVIVSSDADTTSVVEFVATTA